MHVHLCVASWLFSPRLSLFSTSSHRSPSSLSRCSPQSSTRGPGPTPCATSAWGPWPLLTTRHPSQEQWHLYAMNMKTTKIERGNLLYWWDSQLFLEKSKQKFLFMMKNPETTKSFYSSMFNKLNRFHQNKLSKFFKEAGFMRVVEVGLFRDKRC